MSVQDSSGFGETWSDGWPQERSEFEALVDNVGDRLVWYASRMLRSVDDAEDVVQEVFLRAYADRTKRKSVQRVVPYLYRMVLNTCLDRQRRSAKRPAMLHSVPLEDVLDEQDESHHRVEAIEGLQWVEQLLSQLPDEQARVVRLRVIDDLPLSEIAAISGCPLPTVKSRLYYALRKLRRIAASIASSTLGHASNLAEGAKTMHISARMRTVPGDNFTMIDLDAPLVPVEVWKQAGDPPKARVEKPGRVLVFDGQSTTMVTQHGDTAVVFKQDGFVRGMIDWLAPLLDIDTLFEREREAAENAGSVVSVKSESGPDGKSKTVLTIRAKAQGDFSASDHRRNTSVVESDNTRVYTFDSDTSRCESIKVFVRTDDDNVLVFETTKIDYDSPLKPSLFKLTIPKSAIHYRQPFNIEGMRDTSSMSPDEVARELFAALSRSDWDAVRQYAGTGLDHPESREECGGLEVIAIGQAFKSGLYPGWFVPYEVRLKSGRVRKYNLAVRNDNRHSQWTWDGGL